MKLNILSRSIGKRRVLGATKVLQNTLKGLQAIGVEITLNEPVGKHEYNWVHDAPEGIIEAGCVGRPVLAGPNTAIIPTDLPRFRRHLHPSSIYLFPSEWPMHAWVASGFDECRMQVWAAGIDLEHFPPRRRCGSDPDRVLVYFKHRDEALLSRVLAIIRELGIDHDVIRYGGYHEDEYRQVLDRAKCAIWIGSTESQGFALMEAMASGLPLLVLDAKSLNDNVHEPAVLVPHFPKAFCATRATSAPYFDAHCGMKIDADDLTAELLGDFLDGIERFDPASFVRAAYTLEQGAWALVRLAEQLPVTAALGAAFHSFTAKGLRYLDLATRPWAWKLAGRKLLQRIR